MKYFFTYIFFLFMGFNLAYAQLAIPGQEGLCVDKQATMFVRKNTILSINGNFFVKRSQGPLYVMSNGTITLTGNLQCNHPLMCERASSLTATCKFIFLPKTPTVTITAPHDSLILYQVEINKPNTVVKVNSGSKVSVLDTLNLLAGCFKLDGGHIKMKYPSGNPAYVNHPYIKNENHQNRIYGDSGYVITNVVATLSNGIVPGSTMFNFANMGLTLSGPSVLSASLTIQRGHAKQIYAGNGSVTRFFNVISNQDITDTVKIKYIDSAERINLGINKNKFKIFASHGADMDYQNMQGLNSLPLHRATTTIGNFSTLTPSINPKFFRVTVADEDCANPPISTLPTGTIHLCAGATLTLDAGNNTSVPNTNLIWNWNTTATTQTIAVTSNSATQLFIVNLRDVRGCVTIDTAIVAPTAPTPTVNFTLYSKCFGDSVKLKSTSLGIISNYNWQFGDATSLNTALNDTIKKLYNTAGLFYVTLTATSNYGCVASKLDSVWAFPLPNAVITNSFNCAAGVMQFASNSTAGFGFIQQNYWNFNTAASSTLTALNPTVNPTYSYSPAGTYTVKLLVKTFQGCKDSTLQNVIVYPTNYSAFTTTNSCQGDVVSFTNNSICNTGLCNYLWDFGDSNQSIAFSPLKVYTTPGVYNVKLKVLSANGCPDSSIVPVIIHPKPVAGFSTSPVCFGNTSYFTNSSTVSTGSIVSYNWNLGNSTTSTNTNTSLTYTTAGIYNVTLTATSNMGCVGNFVQNINVYQKPVAQYNVSNVCLGQQSVFNQNCIGNSLSYVWDFGNTVTSVASNPVYTYPLAGAYTTSLVITDNNGCSDTSIVNTTVNTIPNPAMGNTVTTCGLSYTLNAGPGSGYLWQPMNATSQFVTITTNGTYTVTVTSANGCAGTEQVYVGLNMPVKPHLGNDTTSCGPYVLNAGYPGSIYLWNTGATTQTLSAITPSTYIVTVTDINNCTGKDTIIVQINTPPTLSLGSDITQCTSPQPLVLNPVTNAGIYLWSTGSTQSALNVINSGNYVLTVTAANGCKKSDTINVNLLPTPVVNLGLDASACGTKLLDAQNNGFNYLWSNGSTAQTINASSTGAYWVAVTNPLNGCVGKDTINLNIGTPISLFLGNDTTTCSNTVFILDAGNPGSTYNWSNGAITQTIATGSPGAYGVTVNNGACSAFDVVNIVVLNAPVVDLGNNIKYICGNGSIILNAGNSGQATWGSSNAFTSLQSSVTINQGGHYWVTVSNGFCSASDTVEVIHSNQTLDAYFISSTIDTVGKSVKFVDVSQPTPTSWYWDFGDGFTSTQQSPEHIFLTPQSYNVSLLVSNGFCTSQIVKSLQVFKMMPHDPKTSAAVLDLINFSMYPNPTDKAFKTLMELNSTANISFSVYEITGKLVYQKYKAETDLFEEETDISELKNGLYLVEIIAQSQKGFVKQKGKLVVMK